MKCFFLFSWFAQTTKQWHSQASLVPRLLFAEGKNNAYYYQVQGQLEICDRLYCDFVCWTPKSIHIERIYRNTGFWGKMKPKLEAFFVRVILPRVLLGQMDKENASPTTDRSVLCYCRKGEKGDMIACDNPTCDYEWFHFSCAGLKSEPQGAWFCPDCQIRRHQ